MTGMCRYRMIRSFRAVTSVFSGFVMEDDDEEDENESDEGTDVLAEAERKRLNWQILW
jgi:hypothetical protein